MTETEIRDQALHWSDNARPACRNLRQAGQSQLLRTAAGVSGAGPEHLRRLCEGIAAGGPVPDGTEVLFRMLNELAIAKLDKLMREPMKWD